MEGMGLAQFYTSLIWMYLFMCRYKTTFKYRMGQHQCGGFNCDLCGKHYIHLYGLQRHIQERHMGDANRVSCDQCGQTFAAQRYLKEHLKGAHNDKYLECELCGAQCKWEASLGRHMRRYHNQPYKVQRKWTGVYYCYEFLKWFESCWEICWIHLWYMIMSSYMQMKLALSIMLHVYFLLKFSNLAILKRWSKKIAPKMGF